MEAFSGACAFMPAAYSLSVELPAVMYSSLAREEAERVSDREHKGFVLISLLRKEVSEGGLA